MAHAAGFGEPEDGRRGGHAGQVHTELVPGPPGGQEARGQDDQQIHQLGAAGALLGMVAVDVRH